MRSAVSVGRLVGPRRIRTRIFLSILALLAVVICLMLFYFPHRLERYALVRIGDRMTGTAAAAAKTVGESLARNDGPDALTRLLLDTHNKTAETRFLVLEDRAGLVLAAVNLDAAGKSGYRSATAPARPDGLRRLYRTVSFVGGQGASGRLYMGFAFPDIVKEVAGERAFIFGLAAAMLAAGFLFAALLSNMMTRPLAQMTRTAERAARGDLMQRVRVRSTDEMGALAAAFNSMLDRLAKERTACESRSRSLEDKVVSRSLEMEREIKERMRMEKELRLVKQELEKRVCKRTEELSRVNDELNGRIIETRRSRSQLEHTMEQLARALEGTIDAMSLTIEMRDMYTAGHQRRVAALAEAIAVEMQLPSDRIEGIRMSGIIHDIGKIAMPAEILTKPARLSANEFQLIKEHPRVGYDILKKIEFPWPVAQIILQHHERMDGSGYPDGLVGEAILLEARILAVADVVEALSSHRPYRPALGLEKAIEEIRRGRGIRYDIQVVDACFRLFKEHRFAFAKDMDVALFQ